MIISNSSSQVALRVIQKSWGTFAGNGISVFKYDLLQAMVAPIKHGRRKIAEKEKSVACLSLKKDACNSQRSLSTTVASETTHALRSKAEQTAPILLGSHTSS